VRNRVALVSAARAVFAERGLDAPLDEIARRAAVGNATLYRHFSSRSELVAAVFADTLRKVVIATEQALAMTDAWKGFTGHVTFLCELQATDIGLADLLTTSIGGAPDLESLRAQASDGFLRIVERAKAQSALRNDFEPEDLVLLLMANAGLVRRTAGAAPTAWRRVLSYTLDGLGAGAATTAAPSPGQNAVRSAMANLAADFRCN
jgi:AcrR family transcriptional regulator